MKINEFKDLIDAAHKSCAGIDAEVTIEVGDDEYFIYEVRQFSVVRDISICALHPTAERFNR